MADSKITDYSEPTTATLATLVEAVLSSTNYKLQLKNLLGLQPIPPGGRLTLTTGVPVTTADVIGATTIYWTPFVHGGIQLWDGNQWQLVTPGEIPLALGTLTSGKPYDVFGFLSAGTLALELLVWTNDTTRATAVTFQDGRLCKSGDPTRLLLGTIYTTSTTATEDSAAKRFLSNLYNPVLRHCQSALETATSYSYTGGFRQANANAASQLDVLVTYPMHAIKVIGSLLCGAGSAAAACAGIGLDSTSVNSATIYSGNQPASSVGFLLAHYRAVLAGGRHFLPLLESGTSATFYGQAGDAAHFQSGIIGEIFT